MRLRHWPSLLVLLSRTVAHRYLGCFVDKYDMAERDLQGALFLDDETSPDLCEEACGRGKFKYLGLQYGNECWCGNTHGKYGKVADSECDMPCALGAGSCGGGSRNSVYEVTKEFNIEEEIANDERPLLALVMMVKDEAHTLGKTLLPLKPYIDTYHILDTGSTDGTQDVIRATLGDKGVIYEEPFIDYGTSRNRALDLAAQAANPPVFSLMLSADETVLNAATLREFCVAHRYSAGANHEAYPLVMDVGWKFDSLRLLRTDKNWRYVGKVHEYLAAPNKKWHPSIRVPKVWIRFQVTDPERRSKREFKIRDILLQEKKDNPEDTRTAFYLARTFNVIGNHSAALSEFRRRVELGGWAEEVYESLYAIAHQLKALDKPWSEVQQAFLVAHQHSQRAEPLYDIADHYRAKKEWALTYVFAKRASEIPFPKAAVLWVQSTVYSWKAHHLVALAGVEINEFETGAQSCIKALSVEPNNAELIAKEAQYRDKLSPEEWTLIDNEAQASIDKLQEETAQEVADKLKMDTQGPQDSLGLPTVLLCIAVLAMVGAAMGYYMLHGKKDFHHDPDNSANKIV